MNRFCLIPTCLVLGFVAESPAEAQMTVSGPSTIVVKPETPVASGTTLIGRRRPWRERNPYFVARPVYPPARPGARANITLEPFTRWYYPNERSYYPPVSKYPSIPTR